MSKALIISDNLVITRAIEAKFSNEGWSSENICTHLVMVGSSTSAREHHCIVFVVDTNFQKRFGGVIDEMSAMIRNCSKYTPMYLLFETEYDPCFESWLKHAKRTFNLVLHEKHLQNAISEIVRLESDCVPITSFCSPMSSI